MSTPLVSVIIPAYKQARFLPQAVQSVLDQTYTNVEIIVVNDASPDDTDAVMGRFRDPRITYLVHDRNLRVAAARNTGMRAARGEIFALLDADDYFHRQKIEAHVRLLAADPEVGVSYNARFELNHSSNTVRDMWRPPSTIGLADLVVGFPFSPSDMVVRRDRALEVGLFDPGAGTAEDTEFPCRLALAGCRFAGIDRALNYRRFHSGRRMDDLSRRWSDVKRTLEGVFGDPRCPRAVRALERTAFAGHMLAFAAVALVQEDTSLAQTYLREIVRSDPSILDGDPGPVVEHLMQASVADESLDHVSVLRSMFAQVPPEFPQLSRHWDWCVGRGYVWKGVRATTWDREDAGAAYFSRAAQVGARVDATLISQITHGVLGYEAEFGTDAARQVRARLRLHLNALARRAGDKLEGSYLVNCAFRHYRSGEYPCVPGAVVRACRMDSSYWRNRGVCAIALRSVLRVIGSGVRRRTAGAADATEPPRA